ncbi:MAG: hypothetical protein JRF70_03380 [Deltaproteobacteria bacterium]|nr:hypothetical protein [Deltaproteobacteria bacterium]MBW2371554.1 hypothetical protein [Deltaproteobacteria bacterium]
MSFVATHTRRLVALALFAAMACVALPATVHAEGEPVTVKGTVEGGMSGTVAIVAEDGGRFVIAPAATADKLRAHTGKTVTAQGTLQQASDGQKTLAVTSYEVDES